MAFDGPYGGGVSRKQFIGKSGCGFHGFIAGTGTFSPQVSQSSALRKLEKLTGIETLVSCLITGSWGEAQRTRALCLAADATAARGPPRPGGSFLRHEALVEQRGGWGVGAQLSPGTPWKVNTMLLRPADTATAAKQKAGCDWVHQMVGVVDAWSHRIMESQIHRIKES